MNRVHLVLCVMLGFFFSNCKKSGGETQPKTGTIRITFEPKVKSANMALNGPFYTNNLGQDYKISKFKFYINSLVINNTGKTAADTEQHHLIDAADGSSLTFAYEGSPDRYNTIRFQLGVDSIRNMSGAQTGALDPIKDMFWTWTTGYIMAKMEGTSPVSTQPNNKIEYHIGGFSGSNSVLKTINLTAPAGKFVDVREGMTSEIIIVADLDKWWQNPNTINFVTMPVVTTPGTQAKQISDNYAGMFSIRNIINY